MEHLSLSSDEDGVSQSVKLPPEHVIKALLWQGSLLDSDPSIQDIQIVTGPFIAILDCPFRVGTFLDLSLKLFGCSLKTIPTTLHDQVTFRDDLIECSWEVEGAGVFHSLVFKFLDYLHNYLSHRGSRGCGRNTNARKVCIELLHLLL